MSNFSDSQRVTVLKTVTSSDVTTTAATIVASQGDGFVIEDVIVSTDATGLAGGTNFVISVDSAKGSGTIFAETVANLGANATVELADASVTSTKQVLDTNGNIQVAMTGSNGTGSGTADVVIVMRRLNSNSTAQVV
jgi:hypothetical protein